MAELQPWQFDLEGLLFGDGTDVIVTAFGAPKPNVRTNDSSIPGRDGRWFGPEYLSGLSFDMDLSFGGVDDEDVLDKVEQFREKWIGTEGQRRTPRRVRPLRFRRKGKPTQRVYGRPREWDDSEMSNVGVGHVPVKATFEAADHRFYSDTLKKVSIRNPNEQTRTVENTSTNPSVENDASSWFVTSGSNLTGTRVTTRGWSGSASFEVTPDGSTASPSYYTGSFAVTADENNTGSMYVFAGSNLSVPLTIRLDWRDSSSFLSSSSPESFTILEGWNRLSVTRVAVSNATLANIVVTFDGTPTTSDVVSADAAMLNVGQLLNYGDGSHDGWYWDGTAHASTSKRISGGVIPTFVPPFYLAESVSTTDTVRNNGRKPTWGAYRIYGPRTNPRIEFQGTDKWLELRTTLDEGRWVEIDTYPWNMTVLRDDGASLAGKIHGSPLWDFELPPGDTVVAFRGDGEDPTGKSHLDIYWRDAYAAH